MQPDLCFLRISSPESLNCISKQSSPSLTSSCFLISFGITILPRWSTRRTIPVKSDITSPLFKNTLSRSAVIGQLITCDSAGGCQPGGFVLPTSAKCGRPAYPPSEQRPLNIGCRVIIAAVREQSRTENSYLLIRLLFRRNRKDGRKKRRQRFHIRRRLQFHCSRIRRLPPLL